MYIHRLSNLLLSSSSKSRCKRAKLSRIEISSVSRQSLHARPRLVALVRSVHASSQLARHVNSMIAECKCQVCR
jgi:hypothetical protein